MSSPLLPQPPERDPKETRHTLILLSLALLFLIISASIGGFLFASSAGIRPGTIIAKIRSLTLSREKMLNGEKNDRINILLLGMGGAGHDGATLTDTIILASIKPSDGSVGMLSIPRDLNVLLPNNEYRRINTVNAYAELDKPGSGGSATSNTVSKLLDQEIDYYLRIDFRAFEEIINTVGGIGVNVEKAFYDPFYPDNNFGYEPVAFKEGEQKMNGERALKFVRSRHGTNGEGNDYARARRQQKVLFALKERLLSFDVLLRPKRIKGITESLDTHLQTNIEFWEGMRFANMLKSIDTQQIQSVVLDSSPQGVLRERNYNGAFVLEPIDETWGEIRTVAKGLIDGYELPPRSKELMESLQTENIDTCENSDSPDCSMPLVEIQNGTTINGLAGRIAAFLENKEFNAISIGNATTRETETTIVYDLTSGEKEEEFKRLLIELDAEKAEGEPLHILRKGRLDFLVILGDNAVK